MNESNISYEVTARKKADSTLDEAAVKLYLTKVSGDSEEEVLLDNYSNLTQTTKVSVDKYTEKTIYTGKVTAGTNYEQAFRLRMWIDDSIDFSPVKDEEGNDTYPYNGKTFTVTVNVYANAKVITDEEIDLENSTAITSIDASGVNATKVEGEEYNYEVNIDPEATEVTFTVETENENANVEITKLDSLAYNNSSNIKRLASSKTFTLPIEDILAYYQIKVTSESKKQISTSIIKVSKREYQLESKDYTIGESVTWANQEWYVVSDNGENTTLELKTNYATGAYGESTTFEGSTAYTTVNDEFIASNEIIQKAIDEGSLISQGTYNENPYYVKIVEQSELSTAIPNDSETAFWTKTVNDSGLYFGSSDGDEGKVYSVSKTTSYQGQMGQCYDSSKCPSCTVQCSNAGLAVSLATKLNSTSYVNSTATSVIDSYTSSTKYSSSTVSKTESGCIYFDMCSSTGISYNVYTCNDSYRLYASSSGCTAKTVYTLASASSLGYRPVVTVLEN